MGIKFSSTVVGRGIVAALVLAAPAAFTTQASASTNNVSDNCAVAGSSDCQSETNVLFVMYNSVDSNGFGGGAQAFFLGKVPDYAGVTVYNGSPVTYHYVFAAGGNGAGQSVKQNAAAVLGCSSVANYRVYTGLSSTGTSQYISGDWGCNNGTNLVSALHNHNVSQAWG